MTAATLTCSVTVAVCQSNKTTVAMKSEVMFLLILQLKLNNEPPG